MDFDKRDDRVLVGRYVHILLLAGLWETWDLLGRPNDYKDSEDDRHYDP